MEKGYYEMDGDTGEMNELKGEVDFNNFKTEHPSVDVVEVTRLEDDTFLFTTYKPNGKKEREETFTKDGKNGLTKGFYEDGSIHYEINFKNNKQDGVCHVWNEEGEYIQFSKYEDGELKKLGTKENVTPLLLINPKDKNQPDNPKDIWDRLLERNKRCPDQYSIGKIVTIDEQN
jgi:antitoxin component YwqK of YwqJK toxin-antitoxin module